MPLNDAKVKNAKPREKAHRLSDERGMYLEVAPNGGKYWRMAYRFEGKRKLLALGTYPDVSLATARDARDDARRQLTSGIDPSGAKQAAKRAKFAAASGSFEVIAREWLATQQRIWAEITYGRIESLFDRDILPYLGPKAIDEITAPDVLAMARRIESRGALDTAHRAINKCGQVFRYAVATGRSLRDPTGDLRGALPPVQGSHRAAITDPQRVGEMLRVLDGHKGTAVVRAALKLAPMLMVRPGELRRARWADIDLDAAEWRFHVSKTKQQHIVPLPTQAVAILHELHALTGRGAYVFPGARSAQRPMSDNAVLAALRTLGIPKEEMSGHGFRATARTLQDEVLGFRIDLIEHQLAHAVRDPLGRAYNRTQFLEARRKNMQAWADYLDRLRTGADVVELGAARKKAETAEGVANA
jgi:integrase